MKSLTGVLATWILAAALALPGLAAAQTTPVYHIQNSVPLGPPDFWDYVVFEPNAHRVYVAHGDRVTVVDGYTGAIVGEVTGMPGGTHGIAIAPDAFRGYTDDGRAGEAVAFSLATLRVEKHIRAQPGSDAMAFDPVSGHVFVVNGDSGNLSVIDPKTNTDIATIAVGGDLEYVVSGRNGKLYVNGAEKKELVRIDTATNVVDARWPIPQCTRPHGLAIDTRTHRLFVSCVNDLLTVVNAETGATVTSLPIGSGTDAAAFDPIRRLVFSSNGRSGTISVIKEENADTFVSLGSIRTMVSARTMALDPATGRIYLAGAEIGPLPPPPPAGASVPRFRRPPIVHGSLRLMFLDPADLIRR
ncbi:MAG TPA: YncE family protein [Steroidobacteraceae bacterium]|nr:YncE family protein [Steroidobacteraceae bacterium]